jgi:hypothetical protein
MIPPKNNRFDIVLFPLLQKENLFPERERGVSSVLYLSESLPQELAPYQRLPGFIGPVPPPLWIKASVVVLRESITRLTVLRKVEIGWPTREKY